MPPKFTSRQLTYEAPPVPSFLRKLHGQVNQSRGNINDKRADGGHVTSEFDDLLGLQSVTGSQASHKGQQKGLKDGSEEEEEWDGAQVVVLKGGKHLTQEQAAAALASESKKPSSQEGGKQGTVVGAEAAPSSSVSKRRAFGERESERGHADKPDMLEARKLIASRDEPETSRDKTQAAAESMKRTSDKERQKQEKNKRARIEKSKMGKGLSFNMED